MPSLATAELVLEPLVADHAEAMFEVLGDPQLYRYLDHLPPPSVEHLRSVYASVESRLSPDGSQVWLNWVVRPHGLPPVGHLQATVMPNHTAWIGYVFSASHRGRGHPAQAVQAMLDHVASACGVSCFLASVEAANQKSVGLLERLGFREAGGQELAAHGLSASERLFVKMAPA